MARVYGQEYMWAWSDQTGRGLSWQKPAGKGSETLKPGLETEIYSAICFEFTATTICIHQWWWCYRVDHYYNSCFGEGWFVQNRGQCLRLCCWCKFYCSKFRVSFRLYQYELMFPIISDESKVLKLLETKSYYIWMTTSFLQGMV